MEFGLPAQGETTITLTYLSGKKIAQTKESLFKGQHTYSVQGIKVGRYANYLHYGFSVCCLKD